MYAISISFSLYHSTNLISIINASLRVALKDQLKVSALLVVASYLNQFEGCTSITEVLGWNPVEASKFSFSGFCYYLNWVNIYNNYS
mgnify:CR=1 FL=1